jgi:hypothetical protein
MSESASQIGNKTRRELSPQQFVQRMVHKIKLELTQLEAEFVDAVERTGGADLPRLLEEFCIKRFDARARAGVPFGNPASGFNIDPCYTKILKVQKGETMREFSRWVGLLDRDVRKHFGTRLSSRLDARIHWWWSLVGKVLLEKDEGPFVITTGAHNELNDGNTPTQQGSAGVSGGQARESRLGCAARKTYQLEFWGMVDAYRREVKEATGRDLRDAEIYQEAQIDKSEYYKILRGQKKWTSRTVLRLKELCQESKTHLKAHSKISCKNPQ